MNKVTIIVPIYNVEEYVAACFDSLLKQTFQDFVVMAVNDGSPKNEQQIIDDYARRYPEKIIPVIKENGGYGSVLELAISRLETEYFLVCDPDDTLAPDALETLITLAEQSHADLTVGAKYFVYSDGSDQDYDPAYNTRFATLVSGQAYQQGTPEFEKLFFIDPSPHAKLYRRTLAKDIRFPHKIGYTDNLLFYISLLNAETVAYTDHGCAYYLVDRAGNTMTDIKPKVIDAHVQVFRTILNQASKLKKVPDIFYYRIFESYKFTLYQIRRVEGSAQDKLEKLDSLYALVKDLQPHADAILRYYQKFTANGWVEKIRDRLILKGPFSAQVYHQLAKKLTQSSGQ